MKCPKCQCWKQFALLHLFRLLFDILCVLFIYLHTDEEILKPVCAIYVSTLSLILNVKNIALLKKRYCLLSFIHFYERLHSLRSLRNKAATQSRAGSFGRPGGGAGGRGSRPGHLAQLHPGGPSASGHACCHPWEGVHRKPPCQHFVVRLAVRQTCSQLNVWNYGCYACMQWCKCNKHLTYEYMYESVCAYDLFACTSVFIKCEMRHG